LWVAASAATSVAEFKPALAAVISIEESAAKAGLISQLHVTAEAATHKPSWFATASVDFGFYYFEDVTRFSVGSISTHDFQATYISNCKFQFTSSAI
jgi:hypothetical protein